MINVHKGKWNGLCPIVYVDFYQQYMTLSNNNKDKMTKAHINGQRHCRKHRGISHISEDIQSTDSMPEDIHHKRTIFAHVIKKLHYENKGGNMSRFSRKIFCTEHIEYHSERRLGNNQRCVHMYHPDIVFGCIFIGLCNRYNSPHI